MPTSLFVSFNINLKRFKFTAILLISPLFFFAQSLTGLWTGTISNDSNSARKDQSFEIVLTEYRGKVYGFSRSEFIVNDTLYYIVKRVKGTIEGNKCEVNDEEILSYNFPTKLDKGVKVSSTFYRNKVDSAWYLAGTWKTNKTRTYYSVTGTIDMKGENDLTASKIFPHLEELNLAKDVAFYKNWNRENESSVLKSVEAENKKNVIANKTEKPVSTNIDEKSIAASAIEEKMVNPDLQKPDNINPVTQGIAVSKNDDVKKMPSAPIPVLYKNNDPKPELIAQVNNKEQAPVIKETIQAPLKKEAAVVVKSNPPVKQIETKPPVAENKKPETSALATINNSNPVIEKKETNKEPATVTTSKDFKDMGDVTTAATQLKERKSEFSQVVNFKSDSLELALYDNGEIDGDTVSVLLNGEIIIAKRCLKATAYKKTIYITPGDDIEFSLVLYAENLGLYPPNTGLLVVHDGEDVYNVRFSADFQKNAGVVFRRKK